MSKTIFLIHGMWGTGAVLSDTKSFFEEKNYNCITPDLPGHSKEKSINKNIGKMGLNDFINPIADQIKKLDEKPIIMGHSMGGLITLKLAEMGLAKKAVLITPAPQAGLFNINKDSLAGFMPVMLKPFFWKKPLYPNKKAFEYICTNVSTEKRNEVYKYLVPESGRAFSQIGFWPLDSKKTTKIKNKKINCPVFQIAGGLDKIISKGALIKQAGILSANIDDFKFKIYENHGHGIIWENDNKDFLEDVAKWIA